MWVVDHSVEVLLAVADEGYNRTPIISESELPGWLRLVLS